MSICFKYIYESMLQFKTHKHHHVPGLFKKQVAVSSPVLSGKQNLSRVPLGHNHFHTQLHINDKDDFQQVYV